jgi:phage shock protein E
MKRLAVLSMISLFLFSGCGGQTNSTSDNPEISVNDAQQRLNDPSVVLIDVRTEEEYVAAHISNSTLIPLDTLENEISKHSEITKDSEIIVYCRSGKRSMQAYNALTAMGYSNVKSLNGGINNWTANAEKVCKNTEKTC